MYRENVSILFAIPITLTQKSVPLMQYSLIRYAQEPQFFFKMIRLEGHSFSDKTSIRNMDNVYLKLKKCEESIYYRI